MVNRAKNKELTMVNGFGNLNENIRKMAGGDSKAVIKRDATNTALVEKTAAIMKCSKSDVYKILSGDRRNEQVFTCYMELLQGLNKLVKAVEELVPFDIN